MLLIKSNCLLFNLNTENIQLYLAAAFLLVYIYVSEVRVKQLTAVAFGHKKQAETPNCNRNCVGSRTKTADTFNNLTDICLCCGNFPFSLLPLSPYM